MGAAVDLILLYIVFNSISESNQGIALQIFYAEEIEYKKMAIQWWESWSQKEQWSHPVVCNAGSICQS